MSKRTLLTVHTQAVGPRAAKASELLFSDAVLSPARQPHAAKRRATGLGVGGVASTAANRALGQHLRGHMPSPDSVVSASSFASSNASMGAPAEKPGVSPSSVQLFSPEQPLPRGASSVVLGASASTPRGKPTKEQLAITVGRRPVRSRRRAPAGTPLSPADGSPTVAVPTPVLSRSAVRLTSANKLHSATAGRGASLRRSKRERKPAYSPLPEDSSDDGMSAGGDTPTAQSSSHHDAAVSDSGSDSDASGSTARGATSSRGARGRVARRRCRQGNRPSSRSRRAPTAGSRTVARRNLPTDAIEVLKAWMLHPRHINHPYPTDQEKEDLADACDINMKQLTNWFTNARKRMWAPMMRRLGKDIVSFNNKSHVVVLSDDEKRSMAASSGLSQDAFDLAVAAEVKREKARKPTGLGGSGPGAFAVESQQDLAQRAAANMREVQRAKLAKQAKKLAATGAEEAAPAVSTPQHRPMPAPVARPASESSEDTDMSAHAEAAPPVTPCRKSRRVDMTSRDGLLVGTPRSDEVWPSTGEARHSATRGVHTHTLSLTPNGDFPGHLRDLASFRGLTPFLLRQRGASTSVAWRNKELCASPSAAVPMFMPEGDASSARGTRGHGATTPASAGRWRFPSLTDEAAQRCARLSAHAKQLFGASAHADCGDVGGLCSPPPPGGSHRRRRPFAADVVQAATGAALATEPHVRFAPVDPHDRHVDAFLASLA